MTGRAGTSVIESVVAAGLAAVALATYLPSRQALAIDPAEAMRAE